MAKNLFILFAVVALAGCATARPAGQSMNTQVQLRVGELERQLDAKDDEIESLRREVNDLSYELDRIQVKTRGTTAAGSSTVAAKTEDKQNLVRVPVSGIDVQTALKNAGYYTGPIDNKIGNKTKAAISQFQKARGLKADGIVGKQTWTHLKDHL